MEKTKKCSKCKKELTLDHFHKDKSKSDGLNWWCKECKREERFTATREPTNYLKRRWDNMAKGDRKKRVITYEELLMLWRDFCKDNVERGLHPFACAYTEEPMTFIQGEGHINSNLSCDRIDNNKPYTKENITFCTFRFNNRKGEMDINSIKLVLKYLKRKGIDYDIR
jgi:hypothetical protein